MRVVVGALLLLGFIDGLGARVLAQESEATLVLDGLILADNPADSIALLRRAGAQRARPLRIGNEYGGYVLIEVTREGVVLEGVHDIVRLTIGGTQATPLAKALDLDPPKPASELVWVRRSVSRTDANQRLEKEIPVILSDTELTPRVVEGEVRGLELLRLPDGTVLSQSGLLPGDVLRSINEQPLRGLDSLWKLLSGFAEVDELRLVLERQGEVVRFAYDLTN